MKNQRLRVGDRPRFCRNLVAGGALTLGLWLGGGDLAAAQTVPLRRVEATQLEAAATLDEQLRRFGGDDSRHRPFAALFVYSGGG
jgi:membrane-bound lytic murein transglycosylase A